MIFLLNKNIDAQWRWSINDHAVWVMYSITTTRCMSWREDG